MSGLPFTSTLTLAVGAVLVCAVTVVWLSSVRSVIRVVALQGVALGLVVLMLGVHLSDPGLIATAAVVLAVKGIAIPHSVGAGRRRGSRPARPGPWSTFLPPWSPPLSSSSSPSSPPGAWPTS